MTFESQSQLSRPRLSEVSLCFETKTGKILMVETDTETENRIWTIFETQNTQDQPLDVETESLADICQWLIGLIFEESSRL